jgi:hypothetical protein
MPVQFALLALSHGSEDRLADGSHPGYACPIWVRRRELDRRRVWFIQGAAGVTHDLHSQTDS